jgi:hypothetical protein
MDRGKSCMSISAEILELANDPASSHLFDFIGKALRERCS